MSDKTQLAPRPVTMLYTPVLRFVCALAIIVGAPFALYHLVWGNPTISLVLGTLLLAQGLVLYLLFKRGLNLAGACAIALLQTTGSVCFVLLVGLPATYWIFASAVANYFILRKQPLALVFNLLAGALILLVLLNEAAFAIRFSAAYLLLNLFLYVFSRELSRTSEQFDELLHTDQLTGAGNRLALDTALAHVTQRFLRYQVPVTMLLLDLDDFKRINDQHGHTVGDSTLKLFARCVQARLRLSDRFYRFGGEEFVILAENTRLGEARVLAEDLRRLVEEQDFSPAQGVTVSIGVAELAADETVDQWFKRADLALYKAKKEGRNRVIPTFVDLPARPLTQTGMPSGT